VLAEQAINPEVTEHYANGRERERLSRFAGVLEFARTQELIRRYAPAAPAEVYDIGGGTGPYAFWLGDLGYRVHLLDILTVHVELARQEAQHHRPLASIEQGDARRVKWADGSADIVLLLGPLYHLTERDDRLQALREAARVLRGGGMLFAVGISRYASLLDGLFRGILTILFLWRLCATIWPRDSIAMPPTILTTFRPHTFMVHRNCSKKSKRRVLLVRKPLQ
jgi:SAM-dependent methyltransferase